MTEPSKKLKGRQTDFLDRAMEVTTKPQADRIMKDYIPLIMDAAKCDVKEAGRIARSNIGYYAGCSDMELRQRVEQLFGARHPIFGSAFGRQPTPEDIFRMGYEMGKTHGRHTPTMDKLEMEKFIEDFINQQTEEGS